MSKSVCDRLPFNSFWVAAMCGCFGALGGWLADPLWGFLFTAVIGGALGVVGDMSESAERDRKGLS